MIAMPETASGPSGNFRIADNTPIASLKLLFSRTAMGLRPGAWVTLPPSGLLAGSRSQPICCDIKRGSQKANKHRQLRRSSSQGVGGYNACQWRSRLAQSSDRTRLSRTSVRAAWALCTRRSPRHQKILKWWHNPGCTRCASGERVHRVSCFTEPELQRRMS